MFIQPQEQIWANDAPFNYSDMSRMRWVVARPVPHRGICAGCVGGCRVLAARALAMRPGLAHCSPCPRGALDQQLHHDACSTPCASCVCWGGVELWGEPHAPASTAWRGEAMRSLRALPLRCPCAVLQGAGAVHVRPWLRQLHEARLPYGARPEMLLLLLLHAVQPATCQCGRQARAVQGSARGGGGQASPGGWMGMHARACLQRLQVASAAARRHAHGLAWHARRHRLTHDGSSRSPTHARRGRTRAHARMRASRIPASCTQDNLKPVSCTGEDWQGGLAITLVDALDALVVRQAQAACRARRACRACARRARRKLGCTSTGR